MVLKMILGLNVVAVAKVLDAEVPPPTLKSGIDLSKFKMTFHDEFDGNVLDATKWEAPEMPRQGTSRWVKSMVRVENGLLHLGVRLTKDPVLRYDCAGIRTQRNYDPNQTMFQQRYRQARRQRVRERLKTIP